MNKYKKKAKRLTKELPHIFLCAAEGNKEQGENLLRSWQRVRSLVGDYTDDVVMLAAHRAAEGLFSAFWDANEESVPRIVSVASRLTFGGLGAESTQLLLAGMDIYAASGGYATMTRRSDLMRLLSSNKEWQGLMKEKKKWLSKSAKRDITVAAKQYAKKRSGILGWARRLFQ